MLIRLFTPVTMYSTFQLHDMKKTYFHSPLEERDGLFEVILHLMD